ncbi:MAG TPA: glycoside hydrolase family 27 protein [Flavisolibacter sp.]|jgi:alpha-galactosidase|nr:glycoside hydrolase family 27 protein [Flavisolibacter sp.]
MTNKIIRLFFVFLICASTVQLFAQKFENLAPTPPMGWNSWNTFQTNINEELVKGIADVMVASGMKDAGYTYIVLDDGWMTMERDAKTGDLIPDPKKFPNGLKPVIEYVHSKGLKFGLYNCAGTKTCAGYPGTRGYEYQDARFYASLNIDYLKFDWCNTEGINAKEAYTTMSKALKTAGRAIVFSLCEWGNNKPWFWAEPVGQLWRTTGDITAQFDGIKDYGNWHANGVMTIVDMQDTLRKYAGPNHWNDPDMLEVGNGLTAAENRSHFSLWAMLAAPLMAGNDIRKMDENTRTVLTNKDVIAVNQDASGIQGFRYNNNDSMQIWFKPLINGEWAMCVVNRSAIAKSFEFNWQTEIVNDELSKRGLHADAIAYKLRDLWTKKDIGVTKKPLKATIQPHDVLMLRLTK